MSALFGQILTIFGKNRSKNDENRAKMARRVPQSGHLMTDLAKNPGFSRFLDNFGSDRSGPEILVKNVIFGFFRGFFQNLAFWHVHFKNDPPKSGSQKRPKSALLDPLLDPLFSGFEKTQNLVGRFQTTFHFVQNFQKKRVRKKSRKKRVFWT